MKLALIILHWEDKETTQRCLSSVNVAAKRAARCCSSHIYLIDNGSFEPYSHEALPADSREHTSIIRNPSNFGFAKGMNVGINAAIHDRVDAVWLLNNDTQLDPDSIAGMVDYHHQHPQISCIGSVIVRASDGLVATAGGYRYQPWSSRAIPICEGYSVQKAREEARNYDYVCGSAIFLTTECLEKIKGLAERNFLYFEELHLAQALKSRGLESGVCTGSIVIHQRGSAVARLPIDQRYFYLTLGALKFTYEHHKRCIPSVFFVRAIHAAIMAISYLRLAPLKGFIRAVQTLILGVNV